LLQGATVLYRSEKEAELSLSFLSRSTPRFHFATTTPFFAPNITMNGATNAQGVLPSLWQEARNADGRVYYYNTITKATQWTKPEDLMTPAEVRTLSF
jgi:hypothetical protein